MQSIAILAVFVPLLNLLPILRWIPFPSVFGAQEFKIVAIGRIVWTFQTTFFVFLEIAGNKRQVNGFLGQGNCRISSSAISLSDDKKCPIWKRSFDKKKCFFVTHVTPAGTWTASSPPSLQSLRQMEMSSVYFSCALVQRCPTTAQLPLSHPSPWLWPKTTLEKRNKNQKAKKTKKNLILQRWNITLSTPQLWR